MSVSLASQGAVVMPDSFQVVSSFGANNTTLGPQFRARWICSNERFRELDRRQSYGDCTQHDYKKHDFDGRSIQPGPPTQQPLLVTEASGHYVPLRARRPSAPYRLARAIVNSFTNLLFGENRFPQVRVEGDSDSQDFLHTICNVSQLPVRMIQARTLGGSVGSVALSWRFQDGKPRVLVHNTKYVHIHEWEDREQFIPRHASEVFYYPEDVFDSQKRAYVRKWFWYRRDWTPIAEIVFEPVEFKGTVDPVWTIDESQTVQHNDGICHLVWVQNIPTDAVDGLPDYDGLYENFDTLDLILSVLSRGTTLNLDPTLVLKMDLDMVQRMGLKKGSDNALCVGETGAAEYMELSGQSVEAGLRLFEAMRKSTLEVAQCVVADPNAVTASGLSSVALKIIYAPMLSKCDLLRAQYGNGIVRLLEQMFHVAKKTVGKESDDGVLALDLPKRAEKEHVLDANGEPTGEFTVSQKARELGNGGHIELAWPTYFAPTADDQSKTVQTLSMATGGKAFLSPQTATEIAATVFSIGADEEQRRVSLQREADQKQQQQPDLFADVRGDVGGKVLPGQLPAHAQARKRDGAPFEAAPHGVTAQLKETSVEPESAGID
jgi:hypothetical protein